MGKEAVLADSGRAGEVAAWGWTGENIRLFEQPAKTPLGNKIFRMPAGGKINK